MNNREYDFLKWWSERVLSCSCCSEPCSTLICGQPQPQLEPDSRTLYHSTTLLYTTAPCHPDTSSNLSNTCICLSPLCSNALSRKKQPRSHIAESKRQKKRERKKKEELMYILERMLEHVVIITHRQHSGKAKLRISRLLDNLWVKRAQPH